MSNTGKGMEREEENGEKLSGKEGFLTEIENDRVKEREYEETENLYVNNMQTLKLMSMVINITVLINHNLYRRFIFIRRHK